MTKMGQSTHWKNTYKYLNSIISVNIHVHNNTKKEETNPQWVTVATYYETKKGKDLRTYPLSYMNYISG